MPSPDRLHLANADVREHNLGLVLCALDRAGASARAELAEQTGLTRSAITNLSAVLVEAGLVQPAAPAAERSIGRPLERLEIVGASHAMIAISIAVDEIVLLAEDLSGTEVERRDIAVRTQVGDAPAVARLVAQTLNDSVERLRARAISPLCLDVIVPGIVAANGQDVAFALDLGWVDVPLLTLITQQAVPLPLPPRLSGDIALAAYAEWQALRAAPGLGGLNDVLYVKSGTGFGAGVIHGEQSDLWARGAGFGAGHIVVDPSGAACECGRRGCLVTVADPELVIRNAGLAALRATDGLPAALRELVTRWRSSDPAARAAVAEAVRWIQAMLDIAIQVHQPEMIILGGYLADIAPLIREVPAPTLQFIGFGDPPDRRVFAAAQLGEFAAVAGALAVRRREILSSPVASGLLA